MSTRREFVRNVSLAAACGPFAMGAMDKPGLLDRPMRWAQLAFVEDDPGNYDPKFWLDYFQRIHADAACLSAGGCVAFYPTEIPYHYRSKFLKGSDPFGEMVAGCRKLGMNVIARTDPHAIHEEAAAAHPEWIAVTADGKKRRHWAAADQWVSCALGPYNFEFMTAVTREIVTRYKVDGVFSNRWEGSGQCYCESCLKNFKAFSGMDMPRTLDPRDAARRQYIVWHQKRLFELWRLWDSEIKKINPEGTFIANTGGGALSNLDMKTVGELSSTVFADRQARRGLMPPWMNGKNGKEYRATMGSKPVGGIFSVGVEEPYRWKDSVQSADEIRLWVADGVAQGLRPWFTKFNAKPYDQRWLPVVEQFYKWHWRNERYLRNTESLADIGMVYSQNTAHYYGGEQARSKVEDAGLGFYQALVEGRIAFEMVHDGLLDAAHLAQFRVLILPNIAALSDAAVGHLRAFVERGGSLVATQETSLYDEWGTRRANFGLSDLFGARFSGKVDGPVQNSYFNVERDPETKALHPLLKGLEDAPRVIGGVRWVATEPAGQMRYNPLTLVPSYPDLPMEEVYPRVARTTVPGVYLRQVGKGRVVYFPWDIDRTFWEVLSNDHGTLLRNAVLWAAGDDLAMRVEGKGVLDVAAWRQKSSLAVHLVNLNNPMMMKGPVREILPLGRQVVTLRLPAGVTVKSVKLLVGGGAAKYAVSGRMLRVEVPQVGLHEVIGVDL